MHRAKIWFGVLVVSLPFAFVGCGDDAEDDGGGDGGDDNGGTSGTGGSTGGSTTGGKGGTAGTNGGKGGASGSSGSGTSGDAGTGGAGGEDGGMGGESGDAGSPQGGTAGISMGGAGGSMAGGGSGGKAGGGAGGKAGGGAAGATAGGGAGGKAGGGAGGATAGGGAGGKAGGGAGGAGAGGAGAGGAGAGGAAAGTGGSGGVVATCDPTPPPEIFVGVLSGANERPTPVTTTATGFVVAELNAVATELTTTIRWSGLSSDVTNGHIHGPAGVDATALPIFYYFGMGMPAPNLPGTPSTTGSVVAMTFPIDATQLGYLRTGQLYANLHSANNGAGEIRAQLVPATVFRSGAMSGAQEVPAVSSPATGRGVVAVFPDGIHASVSFSWSGLTSVKTNGHVHGPAAIGVGPAGAIFPLLPTAGAISGSLPHQIWTFAGSDSANLLGNLTYANVHSMNFGSGEIRGQLLPPCQ